MHEITGRMAEDPTYNPLAPQPGESGDDPGQVSAELLGGARWMTLDP